MNFGDIALFIPVVPGAIPGQFGEDTDGPG